MATKIEEELAEIANELINTVGGFRDFKKHVQPIWNGPKGLEIPFWILRCLTNPERDWLEKLAEIRNRRKEEGD